MKTEEIFHAKEPQMTDKVYLYKKHDLVKIGLDMSNVLVSILLENKNCEGFLYTDSGTMELWRCEISRQVEKILAFALVVYTESP
ncbi:hypothetical protein M5689_008462 [Euphorbia peplus]|nr:hypothetical protein M5689_008462 [Euphorbia peplus]